MDAAKQATDPAGATWAPSSSLGPAPPNSSQGLRSGQAGLDAPLWSHGIKALRFFA